MPRTKTIKTIISASLHPTYLMVENESHTHNVPKGSETHFKIVIASEQFQGKSLVQRHRIMQQLLADEFASGLHALALHTFTPEEWAEKQRATDSPKCLGGEK